MFDLRKTEIYRAVVLERIFFKFIYSFKKISLIAVVLFLILFCLLSFFSRNINNTALGFLIISFCLYVFFVIQIKFFEMKVMNPELKFSIIDVISEDSDYNVAELLSLESAKVFNKAINSARSPEVKTTHILNFALKEYKEINFIFIRLLLDLKEFKKEVGKEIKSLPVLKEGSLEYSEDFEVFLLESLKVSAEKRHKRIEIGDIFSVLAKIDPVFKRVLVEKNLRAEDVENLTWWIDNIRRRQEKSKKFYSLTNLAKKGTLGKSWTSGYTVTLDKYGEDLVELVKYTDMNFIGHEEELDNVERALSTMGENNVLLVGEPGVGKRSIVYNLARRSYLGESLSEINYKRVVELDLSSLLAQIESSEEVEVVLDKIFQEVVTAENVILVIDGIDNYIKKETGLGTINISGILGPYLRYSKFRIIGITTYEGLHRDIEKNSAILSLFSKVEASEISQRDTLLILEHLVLGLEAKYKIFVSYPALRQIVSLTDRYFPSLVFPEKAIDILKEAMVYAANLRGGKGILLPEHIAKIITQKTEVPVGEIEGKEKETLLKLEDTIHKRIIGQEEAVREICTALRRSRSEVSSKDGPMGSFLFLGPTGVGKTETSKALAQSYFGSEAKMIRLDMSEFQNTKDIDRLLGTFSEEGLLASPVRENPFSLVLLDEFEKAHHNILNLFLQVLDEGHITDGSGRKVDFKNTIIIATSNAGYQIVLRALKNNEKWEGVRQRIIDYIFEERIFRPELVNRFDAMVVFTPLSKSNLMDIAQLLLADLKKNLEIKGVDFVITEKLKEKIAQLGYNPAFGAREMRRVIQDKVENVLASALLSDKLPRGSKVEINSKDFSLIIH